MILKGKVVLITGASRGIGRSIAETCGKNGADVIVNYNNNEEEAMKVVKKIREYGVKAIAIKSDVKNIKEVSSMFKKINLEFKKLDILINNAGILKDNLLLLCKPEDYDEIMDVNLKGQFLCMQHAAKMMIKQKNGKIINISSIIGLQGNIGQTVYGATKAGIINMTKSAAKELGGFGITVNSVAPGLIDTDMTSGLKENIKEKLINSTILKRIGKPKDISYAVLFLASEFSNYITGQTISVDGGMNM